MTRLLCLAAALLAGAAMPARAADPDAALRQLFADSDEAALKRNPIMALFRGDLRYADQLGDFYSDAHFAAEKAATQDELARLAAIPRASLTPTDRIAYDVFRQRLEVRLAGFAPEVLKLDEAMPIDHFFGLHLFYASLSSGKGGAPFNTVADYENALKRDDQYAAQIDAAIVRFRQGLAEGIVEPRLVVRNMIEQLDQQTTGGPEATPYYGPAAKFPDAIPAADQARLRAAYAAKIATVITPANRRLRDFLANEYLPHARDTVGLGALPGGAAYYRYKILDNTTLPLTPEYLHDLGLSEVARITSAMEATRARTGFAGDLHALFDYMRSDPRFAPTSAEALRDGYFGIRDRVMRRIPEQFSLVPRTPLEIRPIPAYKEKSSAGGEYEQGTPDGSRPGVFYYNAYDLPIRYTWEMETLFLHEAIPGHHFQISLAQENTALPNFMRFGGNTAYVEGWALYSETLAAPLGMETDPWQKMGALSDEMLRAMRLVVDTGIHAMGWSRDQSIAYMLANSPMSRTDATAEVERYIAIPGQALAYKVGQLTIQKEKDKAMATLGARFDPRAFHAEVLDTGALPMPVLEAKIDGWIAAQKALP